ncbi:uncharacterized protein LOC128201667 [Galleria mellonella]|uniref:Uncharacterized protein LOC128201667 n=1 Tax=Galleria mellonella TaxID=7137 RepID=A0ABM3MVA9_GALME|nr:uncharacterized protein LOC128201667 [Galleria mellonella]
MLCSQNYPSENFTKMITSKFYKCCAVPLCKNTTIKTPNKLFISVPQNQNVRKKWLQLARRDRTTYTSHKLYFCEDHFDLPNDMENYMEYHVMGRVTQIRTKPGCLPSKFVCQPDRLKRTSMPRERPYIVKKQRKMTIEECLNTFSCNSQERTKPVAVKHIISDISAVSTVHGRSNMATSNTQGENCYVAHNTRGQMTPHHEERPDCCTVMNTTQELLIEQDDFQHGTDGAGVVKTEYVDVTEESEANQVTCYGEGNDLLKLYEDHEIKDELVIGPTLVQRGSVFGITEHTESDSKRVLYNEDEEHNVYKPEHQKRRISCDKVHSCEVCSKTLESYNTLECHMLVHTEQEIYTSNEKPYTCDVFGK